MSDPHNRTRLATMLVAALFCLGTAVPALSDPEVSFETTQLDRAQRAVEALRHRLGLSGEIVAELVPHHPLIVAVSPRHDRRGAYRLRLETSFVSELTDEELDAVVAHELGHVWIFNHHPYLQTEQLANQVAMRVVSREALERVYRKVEARGGKRAVVARFADHRR